MCLGTQLWSSQQNGRKELHGVSSLTQDLELGPNQRRGAYAICQAQGGRPLTHRPPANEEYGNGQSVIISLGDTNG